MIGEGKITGDSIMTDDDFAQLVVDSVGPAVKVLILVDTCHSGTIADLSRHRDPFKGLGPKGGGDHCNITVFLVNS